ncbi:MAG: hypothetical protein KDN19_04420 [Verrucomicrobiae bacterium]|nr:hypothetical protein [Verrucomicrobiae bacterium]
MPNPLPRILCPIFALALLCGCEPKERFAWSPNGERAAVIVKDQLRLADGDGHWLAALKPGDPALEDLVVSELAWLPDGRGVVVHQTGHARDWSAIREQLPTEERETIEALADRLPEVLEALVVIHGESTDFETLLTSLVPDEFLISVAAFQLAWAKDPDGVKASLQKAPQALAELDDIDDDDLRFGVNQIALVSLNEERTAFEDSSLILRSLRDCQTLRVSPDGNRLAVGRKVGDHDEIDLEIIDLPGGARHPLVKGITPAFDWSREGDSLVFLTPLSGEGSRLMRLQRASADTASKKENNTPETEQLATVLVPFSPRVAVLPDDRVLFSGQPVTLPSAGADPNEQPRLFTVPAHGGPVVTVPTPEGALPMNLGYFVPSPDGRRVAVVESETDAVAVVDLTGGKSQLISSPHLGWKCRTLPGWKSDGEMSYAEVDPVSGKISWRLWREGETGSRNLSEDWPPDSLNEWLEKKEPKSEHIANP